MKKEKLKEAKKIEIEKRNSAKINSIIYPSQVDEKHNEANGYIVIKNLNKIYENDVQAVFDFNLNINNNEFIVLVGPSGCGKSTTLRMICGLENITSGELFINRVYTNELPPKDRDIAMVFQSYALYPHMSVFDNMAFGLKIKKVLTPVLDKNGKPVLDIDRRKIKEIKLKKKNLLAVIAESEHDIAGYKKSMKSLEKQKEKAKDDKKLSGQIADKLYVLQEKENYDLSRIARAKSELAEIENENNVKLISEKLEKERADLKENPALVKKYADDVESTKAQLSEKERARSKVKSELSDFLYDADEYYSYSQIKAKIAYLKKQKKENKEADVKSIDAKIERLNARLSKFSEEGKTQSAKVKELINQRKVLEKEIKELDSVLAVKEQVLDVVMGLVDQAMVGKVTMPENIELDEKLVKKFLTINSLVEKLENAENKRFVPKYVYKHMPKAEIKRKVNEVAKILEITQYLNRKPKALSGGQRQRVALGRAIVRNAAAFLMDEPLSNLDAKLRVQMRAEIVSLHRQIGATTIYVTHDQTEAMTMADRIVVMNEGIVQQIGAPREIYEKPVNLFVATFIGAPSMNILHAKVNGNVLKLADKSEIHLSDEQVKKSKEFYKSEIKRLSEIDKRLDNALRDENDKRHDVYLMTKKKIAKIIADYKKKLSGKFDCLFGVRPEDIQIIDGRGKATLKLNANVVELLGSEYYIHSTLKDEKIVLKVASNNSYKVNDKVRVKFNSERIHLFDNFTERALF